MPTAKQINTDLEKLFRKLDRLAKAQLKGANLRAFQMLKGSLKNIRFDLSEVYRKYGDKVKLPEMLKYNRLETLEKSILNEMNVMVKAENALLQNELLSVYKTTYGTTAKGLQSVFNSDLGFSRVNVEALNIAAKEAVLKNPLDRVKWKWKGRGRTNTKKAAEQILDAVTDGLNRGIGYSKTANNVGKKMNRLANNMKRIIRTESHRISTEARLKALDTSEASMRRLGFDPKRTIISTLDDRTREQSRQVNRRVADDKGLFLYPDGARYRGPGLTGNPAWDINDREVVVVLVDEI